MLRVMCAHCCYDHWSVFICVHTTCEYNMYVAGQQLYLAGNTNFSPILEILLANGWLGAAGQKTGPLLCVGETLRRGRGRGGVAESPTVHTHKVTAHTVHGCKISNIHGMASCHTPDRSITRMRASLVCPCPAPAILCPAKGGHRPTSQKGL